MSMHGIIPYVLGGGGGGGGSSAATVAAMISGTEDTATASQGYSVGEYFIYNDALYIVTSPISQGDTITPGTNCDTTTVCENLTDLNGALNSNQLNVATVESGLTASQNYSVGDFVIVNGRLRRVISNISSGQQFQNGKNIATTEIGNEMAMKEYIGTIDPTFEAMGADSFYLRCDTYFHTFGILFLSFYTPAVTPNTFITIGHFPNSCKPKKNDSITWTGQKGGTYLISFSTGGTVSLYCTDATPEAQFVRIYITLPVNI